MLICGRFMTFSAAGSPPGGREEVRPVQNQNRIQNIEFPHETKKNKKMLPTRPPLELVGQPEPGGGAPPHPGGGGGGRLLAGELLLWIGRKKK